MKNFLLLLLLCSLSICTNAQKIRFTDSSNVWQIADNPTLYYGGDTTIGDKYYRQMYQIVHFPSGDTLHQQTHALIREDTLLGRVYIRNKWTEVDTFDHLLYRYDLNIGDTIQFDGYNDGPGYIYYVDSVIAIDSILINGFYHKVVTLQDTGAFLDWDHYYTYIEGIGALQGPLYPYGGACIETRFALCCFQHDGSYPDIYMEYQNCWSGWIFNNSNCDCEAPPSISIKKVAKNRLQILTVPNPLQPSSLLEWKELIEKGLLQVSDATGRIIHTLEIQNTSSFPIGQLLKEAGIYFYELRDIKNKRSGRGKLVVF